jgi:phosphoserine phosphatase
MNPTYPDWLQGFPKRFQADVMEAVQSKDHSRIVAFDADRTLWKNDIGEFFMELLTQSEDPDDPPVLDPKVWTTYERMLKKDRNKAYGFAVQCMAGIEFADLSSWIDLVASKWPHYSPKMADLINGMREEGDLKVYVVSSSCTWIVRRALLYMGVDVDGAYGIETELDHVAGKGLVVSDRLVLPLTCNAGKVETLDANVGMASFAIGDSMGDNELLDAARWRLVVGTKGEPENDMMTLARQRGWSTWVR